MRMVHLTACTVRHLTCIWLLPVRRRCSIGMELVVTPLVLVMDEPTSGLDAHSALTLMRTCKEVSRQSLMDRTLQWQLRLRF